MTYGGRDGKPLNILWRKNLSPIVSQHNRPCANNLPSLVLIFMIITSLVRNYNYYIMSSSKRSQNPNRAIFSTGQFANFEGLFLRFGRSFLDPVKRSVFLSPRTITYSKSLDIS